MGYRRAAQATRSSPRSAGDQNIEDIQASGDRPKGEPFLQYEAILQGGAYHFKVVLYEL